MLVVYVGKSYSNGPKKRNYHTKKGPRRAFFYDESGGFHTKRATFYERIRYIFRKALPSNLLALPRLRPLRLRGAARLLLVSLLRIRLRLATVL